MQKYPTQLLLKCARSQLLVLNSNYCAHINTRKRLLSSYTKTEVTIPVPITGGHIAAQLWEGEKCAERIQSSYPTPIICMHGSQDNCSSFDPLIPLIMQDNMTIVAVDQPGHGLSSPLKGAGYDTLLDGLSTIHRVIRHFGWDKVTLIGHSFGSVLSFMFAGTNVDKVHKYVAIDNLHPIHRDITFHLNRTYKALFEVETKLTDPTRTQPSYTFEEILQRTLKARKGTVTEEGVKILLNRGAVPNPENPDLFQFSHDLKTNIPSMFGDPGEDFEPRDRFMNMVDVVKSSTGGKLEFHSVPGTHHLHLNDPTSVAPIISNFLNATFD